MCSICTRPSCSLGLHLVDDGEEAGLMNSMRPSNICALLAKWRVEGGFGTIQFAARAAVVIFRPSGFPAFLPASAGSAACVRRVSACLVSGWFVVRRL